MIIISPAVVSGDFRTSEATQFSRKRVFLKLLGNEKVIVIPESSTCKAQQGDLLVILKREEKD